MKLYVSSISTSIRNFQFRLEHRNHKLGIKTSNSCDLWDEREETYVHLFYESRKMVFWDGGKK